MSLEQATATAVKLARASILVAEATRDGLAVPALHAATLERVTDWMNRNAAHSRNYHTRALVHDAKRALQLAADQSSPINRVYLTSTLQRVEAQLAGLAA